MSQTFSKTQLKRMFQLGYKLAFEKKQTKKEWEDVFALWWCAARNGHKRAQFHFATCYDHGLGTTKDVNEAYKWYLKAAKQGHRESQYNIGFFYREGEVVKQNYNKAVEWFSLAALQGDSEAQRDLGYLYFYGYGVKKDEKKQLNCINKQQQKMTLRLFTTWGIVMRMEKDVNNQTVGQNTFLQRHLITDTKKLNENSKSYNR